MAKSKLEEPMIMTTIIERKQHERLRQMAFDRKVAMADLIREALNKFLKVNGKKTS